ncbi:unnamed protein product [Brachionus calyciflorus]|uniref:Apple domain-containing protein n=1 Tax=Brachionus calyciflorus TaxID=104777 RepID=A0A814A1F0_9BILA|nr:unnamed protein product [Brachionus calyciflorus]
MTFIRIIILSLISLDTLLIANIFQNKFQIFDKTNFIKSSYKLRSRGYSKSYYDHMDCLAKCNERKACLSLLVQINSDKSVECFFYFWPHNLTNVSEFSENNMIYNKKIRNDVIFDIRSFENPLEIAVSWAQKSKYYLLKYSIGKENIWKRFGNFTAADKYLRNSSNYSVEHPDISFSTCQNLCKNDMECFHFAFFDERVYGNNVTKCFMSGFTPNNRVENIILCPSNAICKSFVSSEKQFIQVHHYETLNKETQYKNLIGFFDDDSGLWTDLIEPITLKN